MDPNKALALILGGIGIIVIFSILGYFGVIPFLEHPIGESVQPETQPAKQPASPTAPSTSIPVQATPPALVQPPASAPLIQPQPAPTETKTAPPSAPAPPLPSKPKPSSAITPPTPVEGTTAPLRKPRSGLPEIGYYTFDHAEPGALPSGWSMASGEWIAELDPKALPGTGKNVLHQTQISKERGGAIVLSNDSIMTNVLAAVNLRIFNTQSNQTAGLVFRYQDPDDYYTTGLDTKNQRVVLFKTVAGVTRVISFGSTNRIRANEWNYLEVSATGEHLKVRLNDDNYLSIKETTFTEGKTGLWTMGSTDAVFDNAEIKRLP